MISSYALASILYSLAGFIVGFAGGALGTKWRMEAKVGKTPLTWKQRAAASISLQTAIGVIILILVAIGGTSVVQGNARVEQVVRCQTEYNMSYTYGLQQRAAAAQADRESQRRFVEVTSNPAATPQDKAAAAQQFLADLDSSDAKRDSNPIPNLSC